MTNESALTPLMVTDERARHVADIRTAHLFDMLVDLETPLDVGETPSGRRVLYRARGGTFGGARLEGEVMMGGGDWATFQRGGRMTLDVRVTLRTRDDALINMHYDGRWITPEAVRGAMADAATRHEIDPAEYYFRTAPFFETGASAYAWLNDLVCVGTGYLIPGGVAYRVFEVL